MYLCSCLVWDPAAGIHNGKKAVTTAQHQNPPEDLTMGMCIFPCAHTQRILYVWPRPAPPHFPLRPHAMVMVLMQAACRRL